MHDQLLQAYGPQFWWPARTRFEVILGAYLVQNTSWRAAEASLDNLREAGANIVDGFRKMPLETLQQLIRPSGFHTRKAPALQAFVHMLDTEFDGSLESFAANDAEVSRRHLLALRGVGPETADAILLYAFHHPVPVADEYLRRITFRHQLITPEPKKNRDGYEAMAALIRDAFKGDEVSPRAMLLNEFHALTVAVGKAHCGREADCLHCPLAGDLTNIPQASPNGEKPSLDQPMRLR